MATINLVIDAVQKAGGLKDVARKLGVPPNTVKQWMETGSMADAPYKHVKQLSILSGVSLDDLVGDSE